MYPQGYGRLGLVLGRHPKINLFGLHYCVLCCEVETKLGFNEQALSLEQGMHQVVQRAVQVFLLFVLMWLDFLKWNTLNCYEDSFTHECNSASTIENWFGNILKSCKGLKAKKVYEIFFGDAVYAYDENYTSTYA